MKTMSKPAVSLLECFDKYANELDAEIALLQAENAKLKAKNERLTLRATAVVEDNYLRTDRKPDATDSYNVNAVLLWLLEKEVTDEISSWDKNL